MKTSLQFIGLLLLFLKGIYANDFEQCPKSLIQIETVTNADLRHFRLKKDRVTLVKWVEYDRNKDRILLLTRLHSPYAGFRDLPGGTVEEDDPDLFYAMKREMHEEIDGGEVQKLKAFHRLSFIDPEIQRPCEVFTFRGILSFSSMATRAKGSNDNLLMARLSDLPKSKRPLVPALQFYLENYLKNSTLSPLEEMNLQPPSRWQSIINYLSKRR